MSPADQPAPSPDGGWLNPDEQRAWLACIRVQLRLTYEMNRQLQDDISTAFEIIYGNIVRFGSLPAPHEPHETLTYGFANCQQMPGSRAYNFPVQAAA